MDIIDDISDFQCEKCGNNIASSLDIRKGIIYRGESQKTSLFSNSLKYKVQKTPLEFIICKKCANDNLKITISWILGFLLLGILLLFLPFGDASFYTGIVVICMVIYILPDTSFKQEKRLDEMSVKLFKKKFPEDFKLKTTVPLTRHAYNEMNPDTTLNIQETINNIRKTNEQFLKTAEELNKKNNDRTNK